MQQLKVISTLAFVVLAAFGSLLLVLGDFDEWRHVRAGDRRLRRLAEQ